jgi:hypothetical protein
MGTTFGVTGGYRKAGTSFLKMVTGRISQKKEETILWNF